LILFPNAVSEERGVVRPRLNDYERALTNPDLIEDFPDQLAALFLSDPRMFPESRQIS
jgi:hypothetical protein